MNSPAQAGVGSGAMMPDPRIELGWRRGTLVFLVAIALHVSLLGVAALFYAPVGIIEEASGSTNGSTEFDLGPVPEEEPPMAAVDEPPTEPAVFSDAVTEPLPAIPAEPRPLVEAGPPAQAVARPRAKSGGGGNPAPVAPGRAAIGWRTPKPTYPFQARRMRLQGAGGLHVRTNASGRVVAANMQPGIAPLLDAAAVSHALLAWSGPPNCSRVVPISFVLE